MNARKGRGGEGGEERRTCSAHVGFPTHEVTLVGKGDS